MQIDPSGDQHCQAQQYSQLSREQELNMDTSDDHAVEQQLLGDVQPHSHQTAPSSSNSAPADSFGHGSFSTPATSFDVSKDEIKMPLSEYELLCEAVKAGPYNPLGWKGLIDHSERSREISKIRATYDWLLDIFPNTPAVQIAYLKHFTESLEKESQESAQALFKKFLPHSASPELFQFYLSYVRRINSGRQNFQGTMQKSYEFALTACGHDKDSGSIWIGYIGFVKSWEAKGEDFARQRNELRRIYRRAVSIPLENLEQLWKEYGEFENQDKQEGRKQLQPMVETYTTARSVLRELREFMKVILPAVPISSPNSILNGLTTPPVFSKQERGLRDNWIKYLLWEQKNPLLLELNSEIGKKEYINRMKVVYRRAVVRMRFYSEIWFWYYTWCCTLDPKDRVVPDSSDILKDGIKANPLSCMLNFALVEFYERQGMKDEAEATLRTVLDNSYEDLLKIEKKLPPMQPKVEEGANMVNGENGAPTTNGAGNEDNAEAKKGAAIRDLLQLRVKEVGQIWMVYLRFAWRARGFQDMRNVFREARTDEKKYPSRFLDWRVWDFAAKTEYHRGQDQTVAIKIYETGLKKLGKEVDVDYVVHYLKFLININDTNNARALFERTIINYTGPDARGLWAAWWKFEYYFTDVVSSINLDKRLAEAYPEDLATRRLGLRHSYEFDAIATKDRGSITPENSAAQLAVRSSSEPISGAIAAALQAVAAVTAAPATAQPTPARRSSPDRKRRDDSPRRHDAPPHKRQRASSPPAARERYDALPRRRSPEHWDRERERSREREREVRPRDDAPSRRFEREREENRDRPPASSVPSLISWFVGTLPKASAFDGPIFRTDDLMSVLRNATIPINPPLRSRSPPYRGRPPPDYSPYRGPNSAPPRRW